MKLSAASTFLQSRVGRHLFAAFFVLVAVPVSAVSFLAYKLADYVVRESTAQFSNELGKSVGLNLIDRFRSAENLLRLLAKREGGGAEAALSNHLSHIFSSIEVVPEAPGTATGFSTLRVENSESDLPAIVMEVREVETLTRARFNSEYLWENVQSGTHRFCFSGPLFTKPFCQGADVAQIGAVEISRQIFLRPYFEADAWTVTTSRQPNVARYLPLSIAALVGNVAGIAFLLALVGSSVVLRKITGPLAALTEGTRTVLKGDFGKRVHISGPRTEFTELADSFNAMTNEVGRDLQLFRALAQIDSAIMEQLGFDEIARLMLGHLDSADFGGLLCVVQWPGEDSQPYAISLAPEGLCHRETTPPVLEKSSKSAEHSAAWVDLPVAVTPVKRVWVRVGHRPLKERAIRELHAFSQRLTVALHAEERERQLRARASQDSLTGLLNRFGLVDLLDRLVDAEPGGRSAAKPFATVYMDLDGFKEINDAYGHDVGDRLLQEVARRLETHIGSTAHGMARLGGDEFVFVLPIDLPGEPWPAVQTVLQSMREAFLVFPRQLHLSASLGMSFFPEHGATHDDLLKYADLAMYSAKKAGRNRIVRYDRALNDELTERFSLRRDLRGAIAKEELFVVFQPRVATLGRKVRSVEALLRWRHPDKGLVSPDIFIALAEESGLILEMGRWVLRQSLGQFQKWRTDSTATVRQISINLSPIQLADPALPGEIESLMREFGVQPGELELEITEGALIRDIDVAISRLTALRALGVTIALDDFGTGYSSMSYLSCLPFDTLKIDKSFVFAFEVEPPALAIATAIVALGKALNKRIVAEGVETLEQADLLEALGVDELQGYLYGRPQSAAELAERWEPRS